MYPFTKLECIGDERGGNIGSIHDALYTKIGITLAHLWGNRLLKKGCSRYMGPCRIFLRNDDLAQPTLRLLLEEIVATWYLRTECATWIGRSKLEDNPRVRSAHHRACCLPLLWYQCCKRLLARLNKLGARETRNWRKRSKNVLKNRLHFFNSRYRSLKPANQGCVAIHHHRQYANQFLILLSVANAQKHLIRPTMHLYVGFVLRSHLPGDKVRATCTHHLYHAVSQFIWGRMLLELDWSNHSADETLQVIADS